LNSTAQGGLLLSNVDLNDLGKIPASGFVGITSAQDLNSELSGMIVYNTNTATGVGIHFWDGDDWIKPCAPSAPGPIIFSSTSLLVGVKYTVRVAPVAGATSYVWTLPPAFTVLSASSDSATITFSITTTGTYTTSIVVRAKNACGESSRYAATQEIVVATITGCDASSSLIASNNVAFVNDNAPVYTRNGITLSTPVKIVNKGTKPSISNNSNSLVDYRDHQKSATDATDDTDEYGSWFTWCMVVRYSNILCPGEWRVPSTGDFCMYANGSTTDPNDNGSITGGTPTSPGVDGWLLGGSASSSSMYSVGSLGLYWSSTPYSTVSSYRAYVYSSYYPSSTNNRSSGYSLRCVK
jgi:uncharacterized protein (TIGR02145 family)